MLKSNRVFALTMLGLLLVSLPVFATTTTYTTQASFVGATSSLTTENFDGVTTPHTITSGDGTTTGAFGALVFTANIANSGNLIVSSGFDTTSGSNYLGTDIGGTFASQDNFTVYLPFPSDAIGMYLLIGGPLSAGDFTLSAAGGTALSSATPETTLADGTVVYYLGLTSTSAFGSATLQVTTPGGPNDGPYWNIDDLSYEKAKSSTVPEPSSILLLGAGLAAVVRRVKKA